MSRKVATITCHDVYNYGASLQAYALQSYCESHGCEYQVIDYKPPYLSDHYSLMAIANSRFDRPLVRWAYRLAKLPSRLRELARKRKFDRFTSEYIKRTPMRYHSNDEIAAALPEADVYVAGSDQIWNTLFPNGHDRAFYLDFVGNRGLKVSYAASFATDRIYGDAEPFVASQLKNFDAVAVRESSALDLLGKLGRDDGTMVCDPVFLLDSNRWQSIMTHNCGVERDGYIVVYDCEQSERLASVAKALKRTTALPIITLSATAGRYADRDFHLSGPLEFLELISNARYVVANSFHALAFSLIFQRDFFIVNRSEGINARMRDFLDYLGLSDRMVSVPDALSVEPIDYKAVATRLQTLIDASKQFIASHITEA